MSLSNLRASTIVWDTCCFCLPCTPFSAGNCPSRSPVTWVELSIQHLSGASSGPLTTDPGQLCHHLPLWCLTLPCDLPERSREKGSFFPSQYLYGSIKRLAWDSGGGHISSLMERACSSLEEGRVTTENLAWTAGEVCRAKS